RTSLKANIVSAAATTMSHTAINPIPPPYAAPRIRPITGQGHSSMVRNILSNRSASCCASGAGTVRSDPIQRRSAPAQNTDPEPVRRIARTEGSCPSASNASRSPSTMPASNAFRRSARFSVTRARPLCDSTRIDPCSFISASHQEDRRVRSADRRRHRDIETQTEDPPRLQGIDDPVIPEAGRTEIRTAFPLILRQYGLAHLALLVLRQDGFFTGSLLLLDGQEHLGRLLRPHD